MGGAESAGRGDRRPRVSWDEFRINHSLLSGGTGSPSNKPCENFGTVACGRVTTALGAVSAEEGYDTASENLCRDNPAVKELFACRVASAGCELEDAPCATQNPRRLQPREAPSEFVDDEGYRHARSLPPGEAVVERGGEEGPSDEGGALGATAAALAAVSIGGPSPTTPIDRVVPASLPLPSIVKPRRTARILHSKSTDKRHSRRATLRRR
ncbi:unnamed protein product [Ectocarpus sp. 12 AP-2014]